MPVPRRLLVLLAPVRLRGHALFVIGGVAVGLAAVLLAKLADMAQAGSLALRSHWPLVSYALAPVGFALLAALTARYLPGAQGSGIPQVMAARAIPDDAVRAEFVSRRIAAGKIVLLTLGLLFGASIGREGPTVQVGRRRDVRGQPPLTDPSAGISPRRGPQLALRPPSTRRSPGSCSPSRSSAAPSRRGPAGS